ncbi:hypothetical protein A6F55_19180 [Prescottella equi]|uniref:hypothetical protein n=1 Tax=Rhodococcus hoagii TaxID=43767 RepID=UPI000A110851|nr:hypothetical protein [Prescottella equi]ORL01817.1 hypothetical protein A6F55_19180 [Prescottella equi]
MTDDTTHGPNIGYTIEELRAKRDELLELIGFDNPYGRVLKGTKPHTPYREMAIEPGGRLAYEDTAGITRLVDTDLTITAHRWLPGDPIPYDEMRRILGLPDVRREVAVMRGQIAMRRAADAVRLIMRALTPEPVQAECVLASDGNADD